MEKSAPRLSLVFSTFNGEKTLPRMLASLCQLNVDGISIEIIAVNNGSTDTTGNILRSARDSLPLRVLDEPARGKNRALNKAIEYAKGDLIVFTDDDVLPSSDWLRELVTSADLHVEFDIFGGRIVAEWPRAPEPWLQEAVPRGAAFGISEPDWPSGEIHPARIWGANMMVRRRVFADTEHRFNVDVGPASGNYVMGSETEFIKRMAAGGFRCYYAATAVVRHIIREHQMSRTWLKGRAFRYGRSLCASEAPEIQQAASTLLGLPRWQLMELFRQQMRGVIAKAQGNQAEAMRASWNASACRGYIAQWRKT